MKNNWKEVKLGDVCNITRGASPRPIHDYLSAYGLPWIKISDATDDSSRFINKTKEFIKEEGRSKTRWLQKGAFILSNSATPGIPKILKIDACVHDGWLIFNFDNKIIDKWFLYYLCLILRTSLVGLADGTVFRNLKTDIVKNFPISLPPLEEQKRIAEILSSFDDKIELLQKQNKTLEDMAKAIFKSWFVDFDIVKAKERKEKKSKILNEYKITEEIYNLFPDSFEDSELGKIPKGWEVKKIEDVCNITIGRTPPRKETKWFSVKPTKNKWISIKDMGNANIFINNVSEYLTDEAIKQFNIPLIKKDTVIMSFKLTVGRVAIATEDMYSNEAIAHFNICDNMNKEFLYLYLLNINFSELGSTSSIATAINTSIIKEIKLLSTNKKTLEYFQDNVSLFFYKIKENLKQIQTLSKIRDTLLSKLISR